MTGTITIERETSDDWRDAAMMQCSRGVLRVTVELGDYTATRCTFVYDHTPLLTALWCAHYMLATVGYKTPPPPTARNER